MKRPALVLLGLAFIVAVFASPFASGFPDGLEKVAESLGFLDLVEDAKPVMESPIPDYVVPGIRNPKVATGLAGGLGTLLVFGLGCGLSMALRRKKG